MVKQARQKSGAWTTVVVAALVALLQLGRLYGPELLAMLPVKVHAVEVTAETETGESLEFRYSLRLPVFKTSDPEVQRVLDNLTGKITDGARTEVQTMREQAETDALWAKEQGFNLPPYEYSIDFEVTCNRDNLLSVNTLQYFYTGGAHGSPLLLSYNIDLRSGKTLAITDLFTDVQTAKVILAHGVSQRIKAEPDIFFPDAAEHAGVPDDQQFYFQDGQVVLHYSVYELAPYAAGMPKFAFGVTELEDVLQPRIRRSLQKAAME